MIMSVGAALYPFLSKSQLVPAKVMVVEGWLPDYALQQAVSEFQEKSYERMLDHWFEHNVREDLLVIGNDFLTSGMQGSGAEASIVDDLKRVPGVLHAQGLRFSRIPFFTGSRNVVSRAR